MDTNKTERMFRLVDEWMASGRTQKEFCSGQGIKVSTLAYWVSKKKQADQPTGGFWAVEVGDGAGQQLTITYPNGVRLTTASPDPRLISQLVRLW